MFLGPLAATTAVWAGVGGHAGHYWNNIPKDEVRRMSDVLESGDAGLVVVAVNPQGTDIEGLLTNAETVVASTDVGDADGALEQAFEAPRSSTPLAGGQRETTPLAGRLHQMIFSVSSIRPACLASSTAALLELAPSLR